MNRARVEHLIDTQQLECKRCGGRSFQIKKFKVGTWENTEITVENVECMECECLFSLEEL
ncbi:MAG: hypothetical protein ACOCQD_04900 [archaeon]